MSGKKQTREEFIGEIMDGSQNYFKVDTKDYSISVNGDTANFSITVLMNHKKLRHNSQTHNRIRSRMNRRCFLLWL